MIYADNAATTKLDMDAFEAMRPFLLKEYGNPSQPYSFSRGTKKALMAARATIAECIGAEPVEIYFTSGGSESDNWAIKGALQAAGKSAEIVTTSIEHHAVLLPCQEAEKLGYKVSFLPVNETGEVSEDALEELIHENTTLVSVMMANNEIGTIQDIKSLAEVARRHNVMFHTDAVQAVGHVPVNVRELGVHMLSASAHKFNGPKGVGFLYVKKGTNLIPFISGGAQENGMRAGTENVAAIVAMATALKNNCDHLDENMAHLYKLESVLLNGLIDAGIDFIRNGGTSHIPGNMSLSFKGMDGEAMLHRLDLMGICVSTGAACDSKNTQISHVLESIGVAEEYAKGTIRISLGKDNTVEEVNEIVKAILKIVRR